MPRSPSETIRFLTLDETARLFRAIGPHRRDRALFLIAYRHGLRASEVGLLRVEDIVAALEAESGGGGEDAAFARSTIASIRAKSPTSLKVALAQLRAGRALDFDECMRTEFRIVSRIVRGHDFYEGIRAVIIDKDQAPRWQPASLAQVSADEVARYFAPIAKELELS